MCPCLGGGGLWSAATTSLAPLKEKMQHQRYTWWCSPTRSGTAVPRAPSEEQRSWQQPCCSRGEGDALNTQIWAGCVWLHSQRWGLIKILLLCCTCQTQPVRVGSPEVYLLSFWMGCWAGGWGGLSAAGHASDMMAALLISIFSDEEQSAHCNPCYRRSTGLTLSLLCFGGKSSSRHFPAFAWGIYQHENEQLSCFLFLLQGRWADFSIPPALRQS